MKLNDGAAISYSDRERKMFEIISSGRVNTLEITTKFYGKDPIPMNGSKIVYQAISSLREKVQRNGEPFRIASTERSGQIPISYWVEKVKVRSRA